MARKAKSQLQKTGLHHARVARGMSRTEDGSLVGLLAVRQRFDRTLAFDESLEAKVAALTPEQVSAAFRKYIDPATMVYVKAGDFKKAGVLQ